MGNPGSKFTKNVSKEKCLDKRNVASLPIEAPRSPKMSELDPRSPSFNIVRTPLQFSTEGTVSTSTSTNLDELRTEVLSDDPRSPTLEINRTPIVVAVKEKSLLTKLHNKNLDNVRKQLSNGTPIKGNEVSENKIVVTPKLRKVIPPKLLDSSPINPKLNSGKRKSFVGVLETNIDYTETDIDEYVQNQSIREEMKSNDSILDVYENENLDPRSPTTDFARTPLQILKKVGEIDLNKTTDVTISNSEESVEILEKNNTDTKIDEANLQTMLPAFLPQDVPDNHLIVTNDIKINERDSSKDLPNIKEFDTKLTNLIYQDKELNTPPRTIKPRENNRTPLGTRNRNSETKKSTSKLKVSDKPSKKMYTVSKIPVFKDKRVRNCEQCENTPPTNLSHQTVNKNKSHWDADNTLVI